MANFLAILDTTIANVSVQILRAESGRQPSGHLCHHSYAVAEAISVPLTGWLASRLVPCGCLSACLIMFGFSAWVAASMNMLVLFVDLSGFPGGPQCRCHKTLMMRVRKKKHAAIGIWV